ncbi:hypothetical protein QTP88_014486 [Uroleucon formosanum]
MFRLVQHSCKKLTNILKLVHLFALYYVYGVKNRDAINNHILSLCFHARCAITFCILANLGFFMGDAKVEVSYSVYSI